MENEAFGNPMKIISVGGRYKNIGVALVSVLWVITLLTIVAGTLSVDIKSETRLIQNLVASAQARHSAEAGIQLALLTLLRDRRTERRLDGMLHERDLGKAVVRYTITDEAGKIDLNASTTVLLHGLFKTAGLMDWERDSLVDAILDWRDTDSLVRVNGAEDDTYLAQGLPYGTKDAGFDSVDELQLVMGVSPQLYKKVSDVLTVYSRQPGINPAAAPRQVLLAIPGMNAETVENYLNLRDQHRVAGLPPPSLPLVDSQYIADRGEIFSVHAEARLQSGVTSHVTAIVDLGRVGPVPGLILSWRAEGEDLFLAAENFN